MGNKLAEAPKQRSRRVAAWIYAVINPVLESLDRESDLLDRGNLTWRSSTQSCQYVLPIQSYVESGQWPNYYDFLAEHSSFRGVFERHDDAVRKVNSHASAVYKWLVDWDEFSNTLGKLRDRYKQKGASPAASSLFLVMTHEDLIRESAEHLINNVTSLPSHFITADFWNSEAQELLQFRNLPTFRPLAIYVSELVKNSARVRKHLEAYRLRLSRKYDVPAAPIPGLNLER